jgi:GAF domain-containing protein
MEEQRSWLEKLTVPREPDEAGRWFMLNVILLGMLGALGVFLPIELVAWLMGQVRTSLLVTTAGALPMMILLYVFSRIGWRRIATGGVLGFLILMAGGTLFTVGITGVSVMVFMFVVVVAGVLTGVGGAIAVAVVQSALYLAIGLVHQRGLYTPRPQAGLMSYWATLTVLMFLSALITWLSSRRLRQAVEAARQSEAEAREKSQELEAYRQQLEKTVEERTADLAQRVRYLEATSVVAREAAAELDPQELLQRIVTLISERLEFYHTGAFLVDGSGEWAVLQAASSEGGQRMLARGHRLRVGLEGVVGYATGSGRPRIALDVDADSAFLENPDLPATRSEAALPLQARGEIIGAIDVQSKEPNAFGNEEIEVLQTLADQVAMAISNARLFQRTQEALEAEQRAYGELSREAWVQMLRAQPDLFARCDPLGILPFDEGWAEEMELAVEKKEPTVSQNGPSTALTVPIGVRGQVIGVFNVYKPEEAGEWTSDEIELMETITERLGVALESARLYEDTQRRAARERVTGEVAARMRESLDMDAVLQTAIREMGERLDIAEVEVRMGPEE